jgi:hypothetical protein
VQEKIEVATLATMRCYMQLRVVPPEPQSDCWGLELECMACLEAGSLSPDSGLNLNLLERPATHQTLCSNARCIV